MNTDGRDGSIKNLKYDVSQNFVTLIVDPDHDLDIAKILKLANG
jgi:hypothetical protein